MQTQESIQNDVVPAHPDSAELTETPGSGRMIGVLFAIAILAAIGYGLHTRAANEKKLIHTTEEAAVLTVNVVRPSLGSSTQDLALPGNVQAFTETPIYSRTNGYLRKWYFDIGSHVRKGQLLAEIETPEIDQQLQQSRAELERMQANMELAGVTSNRWQSLSAKHAVSQQEADQTRSNYIAAQAAVDASRANVRRLEQLQSYERITAPFDGVITARNTDIVTLSMRVPDLQILVSSSTLLLQASCGFILLCPRCMPIQFTMVTGQRFRKTRIREWRSREPSCATRALSTIRRGH